jgi:uncharacterized repeat protein (TIGR01451 family)
MKKVSKLASASVTGVVLAGLIVSPVLTCHPQGKIAKAVQDNTTSSAIVDANTTGSALTVNQSDVLTYTVTISNQETQEGNQHQADMTNVVLTDALPAGVQLVSNPTETTITESLGTIAANGKVTRQYQVKVTATQDGAVLTNKACYTSGSNLGTNYNQNGCDVAIVKVHVPTPVPVPTPTPTPTPTPVPTAPTAPTPATLPDTGSTALSAGLFVSGAAILGYALNVLRLKSQRNV